MWPVMMILGIYFHAKINPSYASHNSPEYTRNLSQQFWLHTYMFELTDGGYSTALTFTGLEGHICPSLVKGLEGHICPSAVTSW